VLQSVIGSTVSIALRNSLMLIGGLILLFVTNAKLASIILLGFPLVIIPILIFGRPRSQSVPVKPGQRGGGGQLRG